MVQAQNLEPKFTRNHKRCLRLKALLFCVHPLRTVLPLCGQRKSKNDLQKGGTPCFWAEMGVWYTSGVFG